MYDLRGDIVAALPSALLLADVPRSASAPLWRVPTLRPNGRKLFKFTQLQQGSPSKIKTQKQKLCSYDDFCSYVFREKAAAMLGGTAAADMLAEESSRLHGHCNGRITNPGSASTAG